MFKVGRMLAASALALIIGISAPAQAWASPIEDVRSLLENQYVEPVDAQVLNAPTVDEMLKRLEDPHTVFFTHAQYEDFINSMDMSFSGIGVYIELVPRGLRIVSVIEGSPAQDVKLQAEDVIIEAAGQSLAGLPQEVATGLLKGPSGSSVDIVVLRGEERLNIKVQRREIEVPTVAGEMLNEDIGYVAIQSFGATTEETFAKVVKGLEAQGADAWIMDLRNNPGGYLESALGLAGFFVGDQIALQTKDSSQEFTSYKGEKQDFIFTEPVLFLTNGNSASASEILTAVVKDYQKAAVVGETTYGKGSVQSLYELSNGDVLKITVAKFYSPLGKEINGIGIGPDVEILKNDPVLLAELMLDKYTREDGKSELNPDIVQFASGGKDWEIPLEQARTSEYWSTYREFIQGNNPPGGLTWRSGSNWKEFSVTEQRAVWPLFYPGYKGMSELRDMPLDKTFTVRFTAPINFQSVTGETIELVESESGQRIPVKFEAKDNRTVLVSPVEPMESGKTYWLITHQGIEDQEGTTLHEGVLTLVKTK
ncbi:S41 family peptidase [Desulfitobacterium sp. THU1]|uniref:S41 family peptidase n=1 Tax=Desulfitobacterium sp. THU1 TaxID=3138072 RepID=UPI00311D35D1